jgi:hypothetical protein
MNSDGMQVASGLTLRSAANRNAVNLQCLLGAHIGLVPHVPVHCTQITYELVIQAKTLTFRILSVLVAVFWLQLSARTPHEPQAVHNGGIQSTLATTHIGASLTLFTC